MAIGDRSEYAVLGKFLIRGAPRPPIPSAGLFCSEGCLDLIDDIS
jgi:hypothetical protein